MRTMWRKTGHPGFWFLGGNLALCRYWSRMIALQIKALEEGITDYGDRWDGFEMVKTFVWRLWRPCWDFRTDRHSVRRHGKRIKQKNETRCITIHNLIDQKPPQEEAM